MVPPNPILVKFLKTIANKQAGHLSLFDLSEKRHSHFRTDDLESAAAYAEHASDQRHQVYVRANVQGDPVGTTAATVSAMTVLSQDFDIAGPGHKTESRLHAARGSRPDVVGDRPARRHLDRWPARRELQRRRALGEALAVQVTRIDQQGRAIGKDQEGGADLRNIELRHDNESRSSPAYIFDVSKRHNGSQF